jgi:hypothetical protein
MGISRLVTMSGAVLLGTKIRWLVVLALVGGGVLWLVNAFRPRTITLSSTRGAEMEAFEREVKLVTLLPKDGIQAVFEPRFFTAEEADDWYGDEELVIGVEIDGDARAYSIPFLSAREIVNDIVGGRKIAVTW